MSDQNNHLLPERGPRVRARQQRAIDKIDALIEATAAALEREGEAGVRIAEICDVTGVAYGTVYHHFGDRNGLIRAAQFARLRDQPGQDIAAFADALNGKDPTENFVIQLLDICRGLADPARGPVRLVRTSVLTTAQHDPEFLPAVTELETQVMTDLVVTIDQAKAAGIADPALDSLALASYIAAVAYGLVLIEFNEHRPDQEHLAEVILRGLTAFMPQD
jgi:AcrR family transcriptional regulator